jgi:hypothetical protein
MEEFNAHTYNDAPRFHHQASSPSASQQSVSSSYGAGHSSTQSFILSPSKRLSSGQGGSGSGSHETDILVVTTPPSVRSSAAASSRYSPSSSIRSPFSFDPAPSPPVSPHHRISSSAIDASSPLARARRALQLSSDNFAVQQEEVDDGRGQQEEREENEKQNQLALEEEDLQQESLTLTLQQHQQSPISVPPAPSSAAAPPSTESTAFKQDKESHHFARTRPSTSGARVGGAGHEQHSAERVFPQVAAGGVSGAAGTVQSSHVPEIWGESAATARVLLQVIHMGSCVCFFFLIVFSAQISPPCVA